MSKHIWAARTAKAASPILLLVTSLLFLTVGIMALCGNEAIPRLAQYLAAGLLAVTGISQAAEDFNGGRKVWGFVVLIGYLLAVASLFAFPAFYAASLSRVFGVWFLLTGVVRGTIFVQCLVQKLEGRIRYGVTTLLSLGFGIALIVQPALGIHGVLLLVGIYLVLYGVSMLSDFFTELMHWDRVANPLRRKVRIALPLFLTAFIPGRLIDRFNDYFQETDRKDGVFAETNVPGERLPDRGTLEIFVHMGRNGFERFGHVDIRFKDKVYSYGCYDHHSHRYFNMVSDGTLAIADAKPYLAHCLTFEKKLLAGFELALTPEQTEAVATQIAKVCALLIPWKCDQQKLEDGERPAGDFMDAASQLYKATGAKIYKVSSGPFKTYFAVNTNCVQLADYIVGSSGLDVLTINGISTPGGYYSLLNELFERKNAMVVRRTFYSGSLEEQTKTKTRPAS